MWPLAHTAWKLNSSMKFLVVVDVTSVQDSTTICSLPMFSSFAANFGIWDISLDVQRKIVLTRANFFIVEFLFHCFFIPRWLGLAASEIPEILYTRHRLQIMEYLRRLRWIETNSSAVATLHCQPTLHASNSAIVVKDARIRRGVC